MLFKTLQISIDTGFFLNRVFIGSKIMLLHYASLSLVSLSDDFIVQVFLGKVLSAVSLQHHIWIYAYR